MTLKEELATKQIRQGGQGKQPCPKIALDPREEVRERILAKVKAMLAAGMEGHIESVQINMSQQQAVEVFSSLGVKQQSL